MDLRNRLLLGGGSLLLTLSSAISSTAAEAPPDPMRPGLSASERFEALIEGIKLQQRGTRSLEAAFVQRKESLLLLAPEEARGVFSYQAPDRVRWEFLSPHDTVVLIRGDEMLTWYRDLGKAELINVARHADRVFEYLSASHSVDKLQRYFEVRAAFPADPESPYRLELTPRYSRIAKRLESMEIHLDRSSLLPVYLRYEEPDGDSTTLRFERVRRNLDLPQDRFDIEVPDAVDVHSLDLRPAS